MLLLLLAVFSVAFVSLALARVAFASPSPESSPELPSPPMELPSDATSSGVHKGNGNGQWIVGGVPGPKTATIAAAAGASTIDPKLGSYRIGRSGANRLASKLKKAGRLVYAEPDVRATRSGYPLDLFIDQQWWLNAIVSPGDVTPPVAGPDSPMIALIEESLDPLHPDLSSANLTGAKSLGPDADWHGTAVAAIAGSPGEMLGIRGVWPGARMRLFPSGLSCSTASKAVTKAVRKGAAVINMSYTFPADSCFTHFVATQYAVKKGAVPVAAAGNSGDSGNAPLRPGIDPHVISVGAVDETSMIAPFSTRNSGVDITAPGVNVWAPVVSTGTGAAGDSTVIRDWKAVSGTSFAAPMVSAAAAWLSQARPTLGNLQVSRLLTSSAIDLGVAGRDPDYGEGLLSIEKSLNAPAPSADPYEPNDDINWLGGTLIGSKAPYLWRAGVGKRRILGATLSRAKDPADVYRVQIPARRGIVVSAAQLEGDVAISAYKPKTRSIASPGKNLIVRSDRPYPKTEGIVVRNLKKKPQAVWLAVTPSNKQPGDYSRYRLKVTRS